MKRAFLTKRAHCLLLIASLSLLGRAQVVINELMQSNVDCVMDDLNQFPDSWVELYNTATNVAADMSTYSIGLTDQPDEAWPLPSQRLPPRFHLLVYCDKEAKGLHTPFRLDSGKGGSVYLFCNGQLVDQVEQLPKQPAPNIAYGRLADNAAEWGYMAVPTPGKSNTGGLCSDVLGEPLFSEPGQVVEGSRVINLTLSAPDDSPEGTQIHFTLDGSEPTLASPLFQGPITIASSRVVRAKLFCTGHLSPPSTVHSYIFFPRTMTLPIVSIVMDSKHLNDPKVGIYVEGSYSTSQKNYQYNWRRPAHVELFTSPASGSVVSQLCETRIQGGASRGAQLKSQIFYAHKRFGQKRFRYEFFPDQRPGQDDYKSFILRNAGNDFDYLYMRDAVIQRTMASHTDLDWQAWRPAVVYINGTYRGILNIRERSTADNVYTHYGQLEDIDMVENWSLLKEGTWDHWAAFQQFYNEHGHTWDEYEEWLDCTEFINLMVMNLYYSNVDFPGNNIVCWRPRTQGGRWRFIAKDTDFSLGLYGSSPAYNTIEWLNNPAYDPDHAWANGYEHTRLFRRLMEDETFRREFIDRAAIYMGDFLNYRGTWAVWEPMREAIKAEYPYHRRLINQWWPNYDSELSTAQNWLAQRTSLFYSQLAKYYGLGTPTALTVNLALSPDEHQSVTVEMNGVPLTSGTFDGRFFANRAVTLHGLPHEGFDVVGWDVVQTNTDGTVRTTTVEGDTHTFFMPTCRTLAINARLAPADGIDDIVANHSSTLSPDGATLIYDARGIRHTRLQPGLNIVRTPDGKTHKIFH